MKKVRSLEKVLLILVVVAVILGITTISKAADVNDLIQQIPTVSNNSTTNQAANNTTNNTPTNNTNTQIGNTATNTNTSLPKTGVNDTAMWIVVIGCTVLAAYTYKKVRDYKD